MHVHEISFFVNGVKHTTHEHELSAEQILQVAGFSADEYKLVTAKEPDKELQPGTLVEIENGEKFLALKKVNQFTDIAGMSDIERFVSERLGLKTEYLKGNNGDNLIIRDFVVPAGKLEGKQCDIALACTSSVPFIPHPYFHIRPALAGDGHANGTQGGKITSEWQYWSRKWPAPPKGPEDIWAWILTALTQAA